MKVPFDIKYRPQIESGEYRVETKAGCPVRIVCWDMACELPILGLVLLNDEKAEEVAVGFTNEGTNLLGEPLYDKLFIVTPEEKLTPFEQSIKDRFFYGELAIEESEIKEIASELLSLAKKELEEEIPELEFESIEETLEYKAGYRAGKAETLKDLPRWSTNSDPDFKPGKYFCVANALISPQGWSIPFKDLERLPGFKKE